VPFTPFHWGPALLFGLVFSSVFDLSTLLIASVIPDLEPLCVYLFRLRGELHGFFHSYLGSSSLAILVALLAYLFRNLLEKIMKFQVSQESSFKKILFTSFVGVYSHVLLDSFLYGEMAPFYPLKGNPLVGTTSLYATYTLVYGFCSVCFVLGILLYFTKIRQGSRRAKLTS
jgi:membrane-bound metal-dependent hydrolase YbcI (DUF457 family)